MIQYTEKTDALGGSYIEGVIGDTLMIIPIDPANSDYQAYLNPVEHLTEISPQAALSTPSVDEAKAK